MEQGKGKEPAKSPRRKFRTERAPFQMTEKNQEALNKAAAAAAAAEKVGSMFVGGSSTNSPKKKRTVTDEVEVKQQQSNDSPTKKTKDDSSQGMDIVMDDESGRCPPGDQGSNGMQL